MTPKWLPIFISFCALICGTALAQLAPAPSQASPAELLKGLMGKKNSGEALGQALALGTLLGCTQKQAGKEATQKFYHEMTDIGKNVAEYCKQGNNTEARALALATMEKNRTDPVYQSAIGCYDAQAANIAGFAGVKMADTLAKYARWAKDVPLASREMKPTDICKPKGNDNGL